jgi:Ni/Co efflux regulator RcnB
MKKLIISAVMVLALAGGSVFASPAQNKNMSGTKTTARKGKKHVKRHRKMAKKTANANS